jgi:thiamine transport system permease protein
LVVFFGWPVAQILLQGLTGGEGELPRPLGNLLATFADQDVRSAVWFTVWQAVVSTFATLIIALPAGYVLYRKSFRGQQFYRAVITVPLVLPTIVVAIIFASFQKVHDMYSNIGMTFFAENKVYWIIAAHVFINFAIAVRTIGGMWAGLDKAPEEAAELAGAGRLRVFFLVSAPMLRPAIISSAALVFLFCFTSYGVIVVLGGGQINSIETQISVAALQFLDLPKAAILALLQSAITLGAFALGQRYASGATGLDQLADVEVGGRLDKRDRPALWVTLAFLWGVLVIPILLLIARAFDGPGGFGIDNFVNLATQGERDLLNITVWQAAGNSVRNLVVALLISLPLGMLVAYLTSRHKPARWLDAAFMLPMGVSSVVLGLGFLVTFGHEPLAIRSSWVVLPIVQALIALPLIIRVLQPALQSIEREQLEAAATSGATSWQILWRLELPVIAPALKTAVVFAILVSVGEFGAASLLVAADQATLSTVLAQLISRPGGANYGMAMAMSALLVLLTVVLVSLAQFKFNSGSRQATRNNRN